jgi:hypothetical protein
MPNWCSNVVEVIGYDSEIANLMSDTEETTLLQKFIPMSDYHSTPEGYNDGGYEWCIDNWGTKWPEKDWEPGEQIVSFTSPWSPPERGYQKISAMFPNLIFIHSFSEVAMMFLGTNVYKAGKIIWEKVLENDSFPQEDEDSNFFDYLVKISDAGISVTDEAHKFLSTK